VLTAVELLVGRRWFLVLVGASAFDAWAMTERWSVIQGSSGLVLAAAGLLLATFPRALAGLKRRDMTRLEQACFTATLISVPIPVVEFVRDLQNYGAKDGVAHGVHMRAEVFGVLVGASLGFWRWHRTRALRRSASHLESADALLQEVPKDTSCAPQAVRR
jgi:membrane associated rhomboid family serine protease